MEKDPFSELANHFGEQAKYHKKQANKWLVIMILCAIGMFVVIII